MQKAPPLVFWVLLLAALSGCRKAAPAVSTAPAEPGAPAGPSAPAEPGAPVRFCDQDLSGTWVNSSDRQFAYRLHDHGDTVRGDFLRRAEDGGSAAPDDPVIIELHRTATGLAGLMRTTDRTASGRSCPVEFGLQVSSCAGDGLQIVVETEIPITEECKRQKLADGGPIEPTLVEYSWERERRIQSAAPHPSDGG